MYQQKNNNGNDNEKVAARKKNSNRKQEYRQTGQEQERVRQVEMTYHTTGHTDSNWGTLQQQQ